MERHRFKHMKEVKKKTWQELAVIQTDEFEHCLQQWNHRSD